MKSCWAVMVLSLLLAVSGVEAATPGDSLYQLDITLTSQGNRASKLDLYRGQPALVTMFYGSCSNVCPLLIERLKSAEGLLDADERDRLRVLLVSIDPDRDTPAALAVIARDHNVDLARWTLARADAADVRKLAAVLNVQYRQLPGGDYNHSTVITLLDPEGRRVATTSRLGGADPEFQQAIRQVLSK